MNSLNIRFFFYGIIFTASITTLASQAAGPDGVFGDYFQNMITDAASCGAGTAITGFDATPGTGFGTQECTTFNDIVNAVLQTFGTAPVGQAVVGYNSATGHPIYGDVNWQRSGANISYTPGNVGIGTSAPATTLDVNGEVINNGWYRSRGDTGMYNETYGGGIYMIDSTWVRTYNAKSFWTNNFLGSDAGLTVGYGGASSPSGGAIIAGNVGIGTSAPFHTLDVNGNIRGTRYYDDDTNYYIDANTTSVMNQVNTSQVCIGGDCMNTWHSAGTNVFNTIVDEVTNAAGDNVAGYPCGLNSAPNSFRWMNTCASRACQARGYKAGLVQEISCFSPSCGISLTCF